MTPAQFKAWRARLGLSQVAAAAKLGMSAGRIKDYESGTKRGIGRGPAPIPRTVELACLAIEGGLNDAT